MRNKCCHLRDYVIDKFIDIFGMSEALLYDDNSAVITALTPEYHI